MSKFINIKLNSVFAVHDVYGVKLLSRLRLNFSHRNEHKVQHSFKDGTNCMFGCGSCNASSIKKIRLALLKSIYNLESKIRNLSTDKLLLIIIRIKGI